MAVQLQWGLQQTAGSTIEIATGLIRAATTDNVQPLALLACEQFGNTLAISQQALHKIEHCVLPTPEPAFVSFLKSTVGYSANDCASHLGRSLAGQQFLALATALITTIGSDRSSQAIHAMLSDTAKDKTLMPTLRQVRDLLESIEPRCHRAGLTADVFGCQLMLTSPNYRGLKCFIKNRMWSPCSQGIKNLVDALRKLQRVGDASTTHVTVITGICAPWTISFVNWCIGYRPSVILHDGTPVLKQESSKVLVMVTDDAENFLVTTHSSINEPCDLLDTILRTPVIGMVSLADYGEIALRSSGFHTDIGLQAFHEAMPHALRKVAQAFQLGGYFDKELYLRNGLFCYPETWVIGKMYANLFGREPEWHDLHAEMPLTDLPHMKKFLAQLQDSCGCEMCSLFTRDDRRGPSNIGCVIQSALEQFIVVLVDTLSLSLFCSPEKLQVCTRRFVSRRASSSILVTSLLEILDIRTALPTLRQARGAASPEHLLSSVIHWALELIGHNMDGPDKMSDPEGPCMMSGFKGQVAWLAIYESLKYPRRGSLSLMWSPGVLRHEGDIYDLAYSDSVYPDDSLLERPPASPLAVLRPCNLFKDLESQWDVSRMDRTSLRVVLNIFERSQPHPEWVRRPRIAVLNLMTALTIERCPHDPHTPLESPDTLIELTSPLYPFSGQATAGSAEKLNVVAVDGSDRLRFVAMASIPAAAVRCVLRGRACFACCLKFCREVGAEVLIL